MEDHGPETWDSVQLNKYLTQQLKVLCQRRGFVASPRQPKKLVRLGEHHVQIIFPEIIYKKIRFHMQVFPSAAFSRYDFSDHSIIPRRSGDLNMEDNFYHRLSLNDWRTTLKLIYDPEVMGRAWDEVIAPQVEEELISFLDDFDFNKFTYLAKTGRYHPLQYCPCPSNGDALRDLAMAHLELWADDHKNSMVLLEQVISKFEAAIKRSGQFGFEVTKEERQELASASDLLSYLKTGGSDITDKMSQTEQVALNKTWGVALSSEGRTIRLKKKELL